MDLSDLEHTLNRKSLEKVTCFQRRWICWVLQSITYGGQEILCIKNNRKEKALKAKSTSKSTSFLTNRCFLKSVYIAQWNTNICVISNASLKMRKMFIFYLKFALMEYLLVDLEYVRPYQKEKKTYYYWDSIFLLSTYWWSVLFAQSANYPSWVTFPLYSIKLGNLLIN